MGDQFDVSEFHAHNSALFVQTKGRKKWLLSPSSIHSRWNACNLSETEIRKFRLISCHLNEGDSLFVPKQWYHGTCNLEEWNGGFTYFFDNNDAVEQCMA